MAQSLTHEELKARYRAMREVDRADFRANWRIDFARASLDFLRFGGMGFFVGTVLGLLVVQWGLERRFPGWLHACGLV